MTDQLDLPPASNSELWFFAGVITDFLSEVTPQDFSARTFAFEVIDDGGAVVLEASTENGKFFVVATAGIAGWAFSKLEMSGLKPGAYRTKLSSSNGVRTSPLNISPLIVEG
jgi:hypothetical protein